MTTNEPFPTERRQSGREVRMHGGVRLPGSGCHRPAQNLTPACQMYNLVGLQTSCSFWSRKPCISLLQLISLGISCSARRAEAIYFKVLPI